MARFVDPLAGRGRYRDPIAAIRRSYAVFDRLPERVRTTLRDSPRNWSPYKARTILATYRRAGMTEEEAIKQGIALIRRLDEIRARQPHAPVAAK